MADDRGRLDAIARRAAEWQAVMLAAGVKAVAWQVASRWSIAFPGEAKASPCQITIRAETRLLAIAWPKTFDALCRIIQREAEAGSPDYPPPKLAASRSRVA